MAPVQVLLPKELKLIVFDFDGTLVDSNPVKFRAFDACFSEFLDDYPQIRDYCHGHHHTPRWVKFRTVYEDILKKPYTKDVKNRLLARFAEATTQPVIDAPEIRGAASFLAQASKLKRTALLSGTPHEHLMIILDGKGWCPYFNIIQGAPVKKSNWIRKLKEDLRLSRDQLVFLGDTPEDAQSAVEADCPFIVVGNGALARHGTAFVNDFTELGWAA